MAQITNATVAGAQNGGVWAKLGEITFFILEKKIKKFAGHECRRSRKGRLEGRVPIDPNLELETIWVWVVTGPMAIKKSRRQR